MIFIGSFYIRKISDELCVITLYGLGTTQYIICIESWGFWGLPDHQGQFIRDLCERHNRLECIYTTNRSYICVPRFLDTQQRTKRPTHIYHTHTITHTYIHIQYPNAFCSIHNGIRHVYIHYVLVVIVRTPVIRGVFSESCAIRVKCK